MLQFQSVKNIQFEDLFLQVYSVIMFTVAAWPTLRNDNNNIAPRAMNTNIRNNTI